MIDSKDPQENSSQESEAPEETSQATTPIAQEEEKSTGGETSKPKTKKKGGKMVEVKESVLNNLIKRVDDQQKDIELLNFAADKSRVAQWRERNKEKTNPIVKIRKFRGKFVISWTNLIKNESFISAATNRRIEDQQTKLMFLDDTKEIVRYEEIHENLEYVKAEVIERTQKEGGDIFLKVVTQDEEHAEFIINVLFVN